MNMPDNMTLKAIVEQPQQSDSPGNGGKSRSDQSTSWSDFFSWPGRIALLIAVVLSPWAFASVQTWAQQWITILLLVGLSFWWFETALNRRKRQIVPYLTLLLLLGIGIGLLQVVPLSESVADMLVDRQKEIYQNYTGDPAASVTISLDREQTWHQIRLLVIAVVGMLLGARFFRTKRDIITLLSVVTLNGFAISFFGIIHKLTDNGKMFWVHEVITGGLPFGPFVNRNNAAGYLLMCLACSVGLSIIVLSKQKRKGPKNIISKEIPFWRQLKLELLGFIAELTATKAAVLMATVVIASGVISTLSRGGVIAMLVAGTATILVYGMARRPKNSSFAIFPIILMVAALTGWVGLGDQLIERFEKIDMADVTSTDVRIKHWRDTLPAIKDMGVFGSGLGSYRNVHRLYRVDHERVLFTYAENQYFQALVEAGLPGLVVFLLAWIFAYQYVTFLLFRGSSPTSVGVGTMGVFLVFSQAVASVFDFGFYIPANLLLLSVLVGFVGYHAHSMAVRLKKKSWLQYELPNGIVQVFVLLLFAATTMVALDLYRRAGVDSLMRPRAIHFDRENMDLETTVQRIADLTERVGRISNVKACNYAGELWVHRSRMVMFNGLAESVERDYQDALELIGDADPSMVEQNREKLLNNLWQRTELLRIQEYAAYLRREGTSRETAKELKTPKKYFPVAENYFLYSRSVSPLQPLVHLRLGQIRGVMGDVSAANEDFERALRLAPGNANFHLIAGIHYLLTQNATSAIPHFRKHLDLRPDQFDTLMTIVTGGGEWDTDSIDEMEIVEHVIPPDAKMLFEFATKYMTTQPDGLTKNQTIVLRRAVGILEGQAHSRRDSTLLLGSIYLKLGQIENAIEEYRLALITKPNDPKTRYKRANLLFQVGRFEEALEEGEYLLRHSAKKTTYNAFKTKVKAEIDKQKKE